MRKSNALGIAVVFLASIVVGAPKAQVPANGWCLSASGTDPSVSRTLPANGPRDVFLWLFSTPTGGSTYLDISLVPLGAFTFQGVTGLNGVTLEPGWPGNPMWFGLQLPVCQSAPFVAASVAVIDYGGTMCAEYNCSYACPGEPEPWRRPSFIGFSTAASDPCSTIVNEDTICAPWPAVESSSWGSMKAEYR